MAYYMANDIKTMHPLVTVVVNRNYMIIAVNKKLVFNAYVIHSIHTLFNKIVWNFKRKLRNYNIFLNNTII